MAFISNLKRNVGKWYGKARSVGKAIESANRSVVKMTGGHLDPLAKAQEMVMHTAEKAVGKEMIGKVKEGYGSVSKMYRDVEGGDYESAIKRGHGLAMSHSGAYRKQHAGANKAIDKYGMRPAMNHAYAKHGRKRLKRRRR